MKLYKKRFKEDKIDLDYQLAEKILNFIQKNPFLPDKKFHSFAKTLGVEPDVLEAQVYAILSDFLVGGKSKGEMPKDLNEKELLMGVKTESEHTSIDFIKKKIAFDHLVENNSYYSLLKDAGLADEL